MSARALFVVVCLFVCLLFTLRFDIICDVTVGKE